MPGRPNQIYQYAYAHCRPGAKCYGGNTIKSQLYLDTDAVFSGNSRIDEGSRLIVGARSRIGTEISVYKLVTIGEDSEVGAKTHMETGSIGNRCVIGESVFFRGIAKDNVRIGRYSRTGVDTILENNVKLGEGVVVGAHSKVSAFVELGDYSCIGYNVKVTENVPPWSILNREGGLKPITNGKPAFLGFSGNCELSND